MNAPDDELKVRTSQLQSYTSRLLIFECAIIGLLIVWMIYIGTEGTNGGQYDGLLFFLVLYFIFWILVVGGAVILPVAMMRKALANGYGNSTCCFSTTIFLLALYSVVGLVYAILVLVTLFQHPSPNNNNQIVIVFAFYAVYVALLSLYVVLLFKAVKYKNLQKEYFLRNGCYYDERRVNSDYWNANVRMQPQQQQGGYTQVQPVYNQPQQYQAPMNQMQQGNQQVFIAQPV